MKKKILVLGAVLALVAALAVPMAVLAQTDDIDVTVGQSTVSCTISPGTWSITSVTAGTPVSTFTSGEQGEFTLTNTGSVTEDFTIAGTDATGSSVTWTLLITPAVADDYSLGFGQATTTTDPYDTACADYTEFGTGASTLTTGLTVDSTYLFDLELLVYTGSDDTQVMTATVTITAVAS